MSLAKIAEDDEVVELERAAEAGQQHDPPSAGRDGRLTGIGPGRLFISRAVMSTAALYELAESGRRDSARSSISPHRDQRGAYDAIVSIARCLRPGRRRQRACRRPCPRISSSSNRPRG